MIFADSTQALARCKGWQKVLKLTDWDIKVDIVRAYDLADGSLANVSYRVEKKQAIIKLLDHIDYNNDYFEHDHEYSLVHELVHLHFTRITPQEETVDEEQAVHSLASALVYLARNNGMVIDDWSI